MPPEKMSGLFWKLSNGFTLLSNVTLILEARAADEPAAQTLARLLDEADLLQELMLNNSQLLEFLRAPATLDVLVGLLTAPADELLAQFAALSLDDGRTRYAALAAEILSADVWLLTDLVMELTRNLDRMWAALDAPLALGAATSFTKIMEHLLDMKCEEMVAYLVEHQPQLVRKFMAHLSNPPLMDFLLKLISTDKPDNLTGIIDFLQRQGLIAQLVEALDEPELVRQALAADFLKALITISANSTTDNSTIGPNELTRELVLRPVALRLCAIMLKGGYALANGVGIVIEIIRKNNSDYDVLPVLYISLESHPPTGRDPIYLGHLLHEFGAHIADFNALVARDSPAPPLRTTFGEIAPLGFERFKICELVAELLHCLSMALLNDNRGRDVVAARDELRQHMRSFDPVAFKYNEVVELPQDQWRPFLDRERALLKERPNHDFNDTIDLFNLKMHDDHPNANLPEAQLRDSPVVGDYLKIALHDTHIVCNILAMFFRFPWNNFLHNVVFDIVQQVLNGLMDIGFNRFLAIDIFHLGEIAQKIVEGQRLCAAYERDNQGLRLGYMGHLTLIAEEVVKFVQLYPSNTISPLIDAKVETEEWDTYVNNVLFDTRKKYNAILGGSEDDTFDEDQQPLEYEFEGKEMVLDPNVDNDLRGSGFEFEDDDKRFSSDSESEDDEHFTLYMLQQLTELGPFKKDFDDDDYIDPNDDGTSYKKHSVLYDANGLLKEKYSGDVLSSEESSLDEEIGDELRREASHSDPDPKP